MTVKSFFGTGFVTTSTDSPKNLRASPQFLAENDAASPILATVRVSVNNYVPEPVVVRKQIAPTLFTAEIPAGKLEEVLADPNVVIVEPAQRLRSTR